MSAIYSNITRLKASEQAVSKGTVHYNAMSNVGTIGISNFFNPTYTQYPAAINVIPNEGFQPRGLVNSNVSLLSPIVSNNLVANSNDPLFLRNVFNIPVYEGVTRLSDEEPLIGSVLSDAPNASVFKQYEPYVGNWRVPYSSKTIPIFATGDNNNGGYYSNSNYSLLRLLDFDLPYIKCNILRGEVSSISSIGSFNQEFTYDDNIVVENMSEDFMYQYPLYNAIEVMIATKSLLPTDSSLTPHGGCWLRKIFLITWKLKEYTEIPFPDISNNTISRKYWYPAGLLPGDSSGTSVDLTWERYGNYVYDQTEYNPDNPSQNEQYETPDSTWFQDYLYPPSYFYNNESPLEIIENDDEKKATIKINGITRRGTDSLNHKGFVAKGIAKLI